jgi:rhodanese-related sulfurtransferase
MTSSTSLPPQVAALPADQVIFSAVAGCNHIAEITVPTLQQLQQTHPRQLVLIDVRNADEWAVSQLPGAHLIPWPQIKAGPGVAQVQAVLAQWQAQHPQETPCLVVYCAAGVRSAKALAHLATAGMTGVNLQGGIWACPQAMLVSSTTAVAMTDSVATAMVRSTATGTAAESTPYPIQYRAMAKLSILSALTTSKHAQAAVAIAAVTVGMISFGAYKVHHDPDHLRPLIAAGLPVKPLENWPVVGDVVLAAEMPQVSVPVLEKALETKAQTVLVVDVRTAAEFRKEHLPHAVNIPVDDIWQGQGVEQIRTSLKGRELVVYCTAGYRSGRSLATLHRAGIDGVQLKGGIVEWQKQHRPLLSSR